MEIITIKVTTTTVIVLDGKVKGSRLKYAAPGLEIYITGQCPVCKRDKIHYHAMQQAIARHIPLSQLKSYGWV